MAIEKNFDIPFISSLALREKQIQQNYRPIIAVHKWFARRPGTLFRGLLLAEFSGRPLREAFYQSNQFENLRIADPFMGGGTPLIEANRLGCDVIGHDINPMAWWIVNRELEHLDLEAYANAAKEISRFLEERLGKLYRTTCHKCGDPAVPVKYFLWIKTIDCRGCGKEIDLFPGYLLAEDRRHPLNVFICPACGGLTETASRIAPGECSSCGVPLALSGPAKRNRCPCPHCSTVNTYPDPASGPPRHRMFAMEYHCPQCKGAHKGRFFKKPETGDLERYQEAARLLADLSPAHIPEEEIPAGDETTRLHRWGYRRYRQLFNHRQLLGLEHLASRISAVTDQRVRDALATNLSDLLRYQNMLCRYDTMALKSLDIFSVHGFPVGLVQCESNLLGIVNGGGLNVGSGGWLNVVEKFRKAKAYCDAPFEVRHTAKKKERVVIPGEWIGDTRNGAPKRDIRLICGSATEAALKPGSLDGVFTDPPYFGNVQYAELMDFCYVWLRRLSQAPSFRAHSTRSADELTGNQTMGRDILHFTTGVATIFSKMAAALKPGKPFAFTYHHNSIDAYFPIAVAILDARLVCTASLPCPAEMGASIHINGTGSSVVDTVFVCRSTGIVSRKRLAAKTEEFAELLIGELDQLTEGGLKPTRGDTRCLIFGHLIRMAIWNLRSEWQPRLSAQRKITLIAQQVASMPRPEEIEASSSAEGIPAQLVMQENESRYEPQEVAF